MGQLTGILIKELQINQCLNKNPLFTPNLIYNTNKRNYQHRIANMVIMLYNDFNIKILPKPMNNNIIKGVIY